MGFLHPGIIAASGGAGGGGAGGTPQPAFAKVVFLAGFNGADGDTSATDESADARPITFYTAAQLDDAQKKFGATSLYLPGSNDYLTIPHAAEVSIAAQAQFTVEAWVRPTAACLAKAGANIANKRDGSGAEEFAFLSASGNLRFVTFRSGSAHVVLQDAGPLTADTWVHVAVVRADDDYYLFKGGALVDSASASPGVGPSANTATLKIGRDGYATGREWDGWIDEFRISNEVFYPPAGFTVPAAAFPRS